MTPAGDSGRHRFGSGSRGYGYGRVQLGTDRTTEGGTVKVKENTGRLFEVVQDFSQNMAALETGFNEIRTTLLYQVMFNPTLFYSRLSHLENQLRGQLR